MSVLLHAALTPISRSQAAPALDGEEAEILRLINEYRGQNGAPALQASATLTNAAAWHASDMAQRNYFSHIDSFGRNPFARFAAFGYNYQTTKSETIAAGYTTAAETFNAWRIPPATMPSLANPAFRAIGIGRVLNSASTWQIYWSAGYGGLLDQPASPAPPPAPVPPPVPSPNDAAGVYRPLDGSLYLRFTNTSGYADVAIPYGIPGDYPVTGDWDGDGATPSASTAPGASTCATNTAGDADVMSSTGRARPAGRRRLGRRRTRRRESSARGTSCCATASRRGHRLDLLRRPRRPPRHRRLGRNRTRDDRYLPPIGGDVLAEQQSWGGRGRPGGELRGAGRFADGRGRTVTGWRRWGFTGRGWWRCATATRAGTRSWPSCSGPPATSRWRGAGADHRETLGENTDAADATEDHGSIRVCPSHPRHPCSLIQGARLSRQMSASVSSRV